MQFERKINANNGRTEVILWMVLGPLLLIVIMLFGFAVILLAPIFFTYAVISLMLYLRTMNTGYMVRAMMFYMLTAFVIMLFLKAGMFSLITGIISGMLLVWLVILIAVREFKWRYLQVLDLAAQPLEPVEESYSMRPMPVGKVAGTWEQLNGFGRFIRRNLVAVTYFEEDRVVFGLVRDRLKMITFSRDYVSESWVAIDRGGNVSVHLKRDDYRLFKESYAFDKLCDSLGAIYTGFYGSYQEGREYEILKKLDHIRI